jgi:hypothetical protein
MHAFFIFLVFLSSLQDTAICSPVLNNNIDITWVRPWWEHAADRLDETRQGNVDTGNIFLENVKKEDSFETEILSSEKSKEFDTPHHTPSQVEVHGHQQNDQAYRGETDDEDDFSDHTLQSDAENQDDVRRKVQEETKATENTEDIEFGESSGQRLYTETTQTWNKWSDGNEFSTNELYPDFVIRNGFAVPSEEKSSPVQQYFVTFKRVRGADIVDKVSISVSTGDVDIQLRRPDFVSLAVAKTITLLTPWYARLLRIFPRRAWSDISLDDVSVIMTLINRDTGEFRREKQSLDGWLTTPPRAIKCPSVRAGRYDACISLQYGRNWPKTLLYVRFSIPSIE